MVNGNVYTMNRLLSNTQLDGLDTETERKLQKAEEWNKNWNKINSPVVSFNNKGIAFEKSGEMDKAIKEYEKCLDWIYARFDGIYMKNIAWHSPDRLRVLYKKLKSPKEKDFLIRFTSFCKTNGVDYPQIYNKALSVLYKS